MASNVENPGNLPPDQDDLPEAHVGDDVRLDEPDHIHVVTGSTRDVPGPLEDVVKVEGAVEEDAASGQNEGRARALSFSPDGVPTAIDLEDVAQLITRDENFVWIDLCHAPRALHRVADALHFSRLEREAALSTWQRPTLHVQGDRFFVAATLSHSDLRERRLVAARLSLFVGRNFLLSVHQDELPFDDSLLARVRLNPDLPRLDSAYMLYILLDGLLEHYEDQADDMDEQIEHMELQALLEADDAFLGELLRLKRYAYALNRLAEQHRQVFEAFMRADFPFIAGDEVSGYFHNLDGRLYRLLENLAGAKESVNGAFDIYVSRVSHQTNQVIRVLTIISALLLPMTVILSFFGTGFRSQGYLYSQTAFVVMVCLLLGVTGVLLFLFRQRGWF